MQSQKVSIFIDLVKGANFAAGLKAIDAVSDGLSAAADVTKDLAVQSMRLAGDFQVTTNALAVFTGSVRLAKNELGEIAELSRNTAGLRLESAEQGYQRLRALGFESKIAKGFIKELGEEKLLSGSSDEALSKIIFNFTQIASGGQKVSQELREILTQMPSMERAFFDAFGTLDPKKIQSFFDKDTKGAFQKLIDTMAKGEAAAGGLNDSFGKLSDEFDLLGRAAGIPFLDPVTKDIRDLTKYFQENESTARQWGQSLADIYRGVSDASRLIGGEPAAGRSGILRGLAAAGTYGLSETVLSFGAAGKMAREKEEAAKPKQGKSGLFDHLLETDKERKARELAEAKDRLRAVEKAKGQELTLLKNSADEAESILKNRFDIEQSIRDVATRYTAKQEIDFIRESSLRRGIYIQSEIAQQTGFFNKQIELQSGNDEEVAKLQSEKNKTLNQLNAERQINDAKTLRQVAELENRIYEERRKAAIDFKGLQIRESESRLDKETFDITRQIERQSSLSLAGFDQLKTLTQSNYEEILHLTREQYKQQLEDLSLTDEQRTNIFKEMYLTEQELAEKNRREILRIEDDKRRKQLEKIQSFFGDLNSILDNQSANSNAILSSIFKFENLKHSNKISLD